MNRKSKLPTRRDLFSAASLTAAGFAAAVTTPETAVALPVATEKKFSTLESFKYDIESETGWVGPAGSAKEATVLQFPMSESIAGVSMRLKPGAMRELHWHA